MVPQLVNGRAAAWPRALSKTALGNYGEGSPFCNMVKNHPSARSLFSIIKQFFYFNFFFPFLGLHLWHMEVTRLRVESELQHWIFNPLSEARGGTHILMDASQVLNPLSHIGNPLKQVFESAGCTIPLFFTKQETMGTKIKMQPHGEVGIIQISFLF